MTNASRHSTGGVWFSLFPQALHWQGRSLAAVKCWAMMSWFLVIAVLLSAPILTPCSAMQPHGSMYGSSTQGSNHLFPSDVLSDVDDFFDPSHSRGSGSSSMARDARSTWADREEGGMDALRNFASTRATKTGTTIAGVAFKVSHGLERRNTRVG